MFFNNKRKENDKKSLQELMKRASRSFDFTQYTYQAGQHKVWIYYLRTLINNETLNRSVLPYLHKKVDSFESFVNVIPIEDIKVTNDVDKIKAEYLRGKVIIQEDRENGNCLIINIPKNESRQISTSEVEFSVVGPKESFIENMDTNINLIRKRLPLPQLEFKEMTIGKLTKTKVSVCYIKGIANDENINTITQRLEDLEFDQINDSTYLMQLISDHSSSIFPLFINTERPDRVAAVLAEGKVCVLTSGSPSVLIMPTTLTEFFSAVEDYYINWIMGTAFRIIRLFSVMFSIFATPLYVAVLTYHFEMVPKDLLSTLISSRANIPFPPILEVLFLELTIELLREAGARLPTKVGQTLGIVGGIVIGQASVEAGLTSNILLIVVALAALASFTTPIYKMANTIRLLRFPFVICAQIWGLVGIMIGLAFLLTHLIRLESLGRPYMEPIYPLRLSDVSDAILRMPFSRSTRRPMLMRPKDRNRVNSKRAAKRKDIDE
ncbi:spore germination protein [Tuberibacillus sp. Marseille-P3662]|uniref:spore germination protein n=1 Tax=Tuberibacillus sp. Marseille-P3662 TaxID=1965358 RepID=UPI0020CA9EC0|nr:spore germination protein [Tuberibacillus sp. Marseille-P3662]